MERAATVTIRLLLDGLVTDCHYLGKSSLICDYGKAASQDW